MANDSIVVRGARVHNLKNIDVEIPHNALTVVTGVSGSGKSSLAFDTIYAEGQRRYVESLSAYARQFLERIEKPDADSIEGIAPAVAIKQKNSTRNPRSTVATATEIHDYMRLLFARVGRTYCRNCGNELRKDTVDHVAEAILAHPEGTRFNVLFPIHATATQPANALEENRVEGEDDPPRKKLAAKSAKAKKTAKAEDNTPLLVQSLPEATKERLFELRKRGFNRLYQAGSIFEFSSPESLLDLNFAEPVYVLIDRLAVASDIRARLVDAVEAGYRESGEVIFETAPRSAEGGKEAAPQQLRYSQRFECKQCLIAYDEPEPRLFSFNNPYGACPRCHGFGNTIDLDLNLVIPNPGLSIDQGAIEPWTKPKYRPIQSDLKKFCKTEDIPLDVPWAELEESHWNLVLNGKGRFLGVRGFFHYLERKKYKMHIRVFLSRYRGYATCSMCNGTRLKPEARQVKVGGADICQVCAMTVENSARFFAHLELRPQEAAMAERLLQEIRERLGFLQEVGLEYLTLDRMASTLSGGEAQRIQLATSLGSRLVGTLYVLDEPSIGLHTRDTHRLIGILEGLRDLGNTIVVVEHDPDIMRSADRILDLGPGAGEHGGKVIAQGTYAEILKQPASLTGRYLSGDLRIQVPTARRQPGKQRIVVSGARSHNVKGIDVTLPLGMLVAVTGVSGSGKSSLVHEVIFRALNAELGESPASEGSSWKTITGVQHLDDVVMVDQSPIGRTPRSNPVTYIKAFDAIRELFASQADAHKRGFGPGHFSFNIPGGRCETCQGDGTVTVEMQFLADVELICEECKGTRFKPQVLEVKYKQHSIYEVLQLTVKEGLQFFAGIPKIMDKLKPLEDVGLGYLRLGQSATTLSGGEAQRLKLAAHLQPRAKAITAADGTVTKARRHTLYILDEPTTGLHYDDISKLLAAFRRLIEAGGSILIVEHNLEVIKTADWVIDLGPEGGDRGGKIVVAGTPEDVAANPDSHTGRFLGPLLAHS